MVYGRQIANARFMIAKYGEECTWYSRGEPTGGTPAKPATRPVTEHPGIPLVFFPTPSNADQSAEQGTEIEAGGLMAYMGAVDFTPSNGDTLTRSNGEKLTVRLKNGIEVLAPNGDPILYTIRFER